MDYPVTLKVEYPERLSRLTTFFRYLMTIPQYVAIIFVSIAAYVVMFLSWWAILFTGRYPESFFNFVTWYLRWYARFDGYAYFLTDKYPPFSGRVETDYPVILEIEQPEKLSRLTTFFRLPIIPMPAASLGSQWKLQPQAMPGLPMAIPQYLALAFVSIAAGIILFLSWWAILFTAKYPRVFFNFITWWFRWSMRVTGYVYLLTDKYPPFSGAE
jgi:hypothetical protein